MTDDSLVEWVAGWLAASPPDDPGFRDRFVAGLRAELAARQRDCQTACLEAEAAGITSERARILAFLANNDAAGVIYGESSGEMRRTVVLTLRAAANAIHRGEHQRSG